MRYEVLKNSCPPNAQKRKMASSWPAGNYLEVEIDFFLNDSRIYHQISVRLSRCSSAASIWGWSKTCATFCAPRDLSQSSNVLDDHGFMIAMYSFVPMSFQAWIDFIRGRVSDRLVPLSLTTTQSSIRGPLPCAAGTSILLVVSAVLFQDGLF